WNRRQEGGHAPPFFFWSPMRPIAGRDQGAPSGQALPATRPDTVARHATAKSSAQHRSREASNLKSAILTGVFDTNVSVPISPRSYGITRWWRRRRRGLEIGLSHGACGETSEGNKP